MVTAKRQKQLEKYLTEAMLELEHPESIANVIDNDFKQKYEGFSSVFVRDLSNGGYKLDDDLILDDNKKTDIWDKGLILTIDAGGNHIVTFILIKGRIFTIGFLYVDSRHKRDEEMPSATNKIYPIIKNVTDRLGIKIPSNLNECTVVADQDNSIIETPDHIIEAGDMLNFQYRILGCVEYTKTTQTNLENISERIKSRRGSDRQFTSDFIYNKIRGMIPFSSLQRNCLSFSNEITPSKPWVGWLQNLGYAAPKTFGGIGKPYDKTLVAEINKEWKTWMRDHEKDTMEMLALAKQKMYVNRLYTPFDTILLWFGNKEDPGMMIRKQKTN